MALADQGAQKAFVTGTEVPIADLDLAEVTVDVLVNGVLQERANSSEVLGTPVASIQWLANKLAQFDRKLEAGSHVMSGSFTKQYPISGEDIVESKFDPIGLVSAQFR